MLQHHPSGSWRRTLYGLLAAVAVMTLAACGGGSGAPNNPYTPGPSLLTVTPAAVTAYPGVATTLSVTGGTPPYRAFSSNSGVLPVAQTMTGSLLTLVAGGIDSDTTVTITIQDSGGQSAVATVSVKAQQPVALTVVPSVAIAYSGIASTLTVTGGVPPYRASSSNTTVLPVAQAVPGTTVVLLAGNVGGDTAVDVTIQDASGQRATAAVTVRAAPLLNSLTITPSGSDCGTSAICSGQNGTAVVMVLGPEGAALAGRQVKFDVIAGPYGITALTAGQPVVNTLTVTSDSTGQASVLIKANVDAPTQYAQLRVTELTSGQQLVGNFLIQQVTDGSKVLAVVPSTATITGAFKGECSAGFRVDYFIYGGTPPYHVSSTFPSAVTIVNPTVNASGGFFEAITNGTCVNPLTFTIVDATGRQTTATLVNAEGSAEAPITPAALAITPNTVSGACTSNAPFPFIITGGTPPFGVAAVGGAAVPPVVATSPGSVQINITDGIVGPHNVQVVDSSKPQLTTTATITCK